MTAHAHDPNPVPPTPDPTIRLFRPDGTTVRIPLPQLRSLPSVDVPQCYIVSTGHGTSGPFVFGGVRLLELVEQFVDSPWSQIEIISADGFGNRVMRSELVTEDPAGPILLAHSIDGGPMTRDEGVVRLFVPSETDDALRQVKWVETIRVR